MVGGVHAGKVLLFNLVHHAPVLSDNPSADYLGADCASEQPRNRELSGLIVYYSALFFGALLIRELSPNGTIARRD